MRIIDCVVAKNGNKAEGEIEVEENKSDVDIFDVAVVVSFVVRLDVSVVLK